MEGRSPDHSKENRDAHIDPRTCSGAVVSLTAATALNRKRRREAARRAAACRRVAIQRGRRHVCPLIDLLAEYGAITGVLPYPSQETLARDAGVSTRTIGRWLAILEHELRLVDVHRSRPVTDRHTGQFVSRNTNRYVLCDRRAYRAPRSCPVPRRHRADDGGAVAPVEPPAAVEAPQRRPLPPPVPEPTEVDDGPTVPAGQALRRIASMRRELSPTYRTSMSSNPSKEG